MKIDHQYTSSPLSMTYHNLETPRGSNKFIIKPALKSIDWLNLGCSAVSTSLHQSEQILKTSKRAITCIDLPKKIGRLKESVNDLKNIAGIGDFYVKGSEVFKHSTSILGLGAGLIELAYQQNILPLSQQQLLVLDILGFLGCLAIVMKGLADIKELFYTLRNSQGGEPEFNLALFRMILKICSIATAGFGMIAFIVSGNVVGKGILFSLSIFSFLLSISKYYYEQLSDINQK